MKEENDKKNNNKLNSNNNYNNSNDIWLLYDNGHRNKNTTKSK